MRRSVAIALWLLSATAAALPPRATLAADEKPYFLVATPQMVGPVFRQSVIMMVPTVEPGLVAGVIINEPTGTSALQAFPHLPAPRNDPGNAYYGGPVPSQPTLVLRTAHPPDHAEQVVDDVYVSTDADTIARIIKDGTGRARLRIFLGRAQWLPEQLHAEVMDGAWYVVPADADQVFSTDPAHLWRKLVERGQLQETSFTPPPMRAPR